MCIAKFYSKDVHSILRNSEIEQLWRKESKLPIDTQTQIIEQWMEGTLALIIPMREGIEISKRYGE